MPAPVNTGPPTRPLRIVWHNGKRYVLSHDQQIAYDYFGETHYWELIDAGVVFDFSFSFMNAPSPSSVNKASKIDDRSAFGAIVPEGAAMTIPYGRQRIAGKTIGQWSDSGYRGVFFVAIGEGEIDGIDHYYLNGYDVAGWQDGAGFYYWPLNTLYTGTQSQSPDGEWVRLGVQSGFPNTAYAKIEGHDQTTVAWGQADWTRHIPDKAGIKEWGFDVRGLKIPETRENILTYSEDFSGSKWADNTAPASRVSGITDPFGGTAAWKWTAGASGFNSYQFSTGAPGPEGYLTGSVWMRATTGTPTVTVAVLRYDRPSVSEQTSTAFALTSTWTRYTVTLGPGTRGGYLGLLNVITAVNGAQVELFGAQVEASPTSHGYVKTAGTQILARENLFANSETYASGWGFDYTAPTIVTAAITGPFNDTNKSCQMSFVNHASNSQDAYKPTSVLCTPGEMVVYSVWLKAPSGNVTCQLLVGNSGGGDYSTPTITITNAWQRFSASRIVQNAGTGVATLGGLAGIPANSVIQVFGAQMERRGTPGPYLSTDSVYSGSGAYIARPKKYFQTGTSEELGSNGANVFYDWLTSTTHGCAVTPEYINEESFGNAAYTCWRDGLNINYAISADLTAQQVREQMELAIHGHLYMADGKYCLFIDQPQTNVVAAFDWRTNCRNVSYVPLTTQDQPTRVIIDYANSANKYAIESSTAENPNVTSGLQVAREARFKSDAISTAVQANKIATYTLNRATYGLKVTFVGSYLGVILKIGDLITLTTDEGLNAQQFVIQSAEEQESGEWAIAAQIYNAAVYSVTPITADTPPATWLQDPTVAPPMPGFNLADGSGNDVTPNSALMLPSFTPYAYFDLPRTPDAATLYGSTWTAGAGVTNFTASYVNNGVNNVRCATLEPGYWGGYLNLDLGAGVAKDFFSVDVSGPVGMGYDWTIEYSDNGSSWTAVKPDMNPSQFGIVVHTSTISWPSVGSHRYWRISYYTADMVYGDNTTYLDVNEVQFYTYNQSYWPLSHYEVRAFTGTGAILGTIPAYKYTVAAPVDLTPFLAYNQYAGYPQAYLDLWITPINTFGTKGTGREFIEYNNNVNPSGQNLASGQFAAAQLGATATVTQPNTSTAISGEEKSGTKTFIEQAAPAVSNSGETKLYADSTSHNLRISKNGAAYVDLGVIGASGSTNYLPKFTAASVLGNSRLADDGTSLLLNAGLAPVTGAGLNIGRNMGTIGVSSYSIGHIQCYTSDASYPGIGFHRGGYSATFIYHVGYGAGNRLKYFDPDGSNGYFVTSDQISQSASGNTIPIRDSNGYLFGTYWNFSADDQGVTAPYRVMGKTSSDNYGRWFDINSVPPNAQTSAYTLVLADAGKHIAITTGGVTVPASVFTAGHIITIYNNSASAQTITQGGSVTMYLGGTATTGNRTLAQRGIATVLCVASNTFVISGAGLT